MTCYVLHDMGNIEDDGDIPIDIMFSMLWPVIFAAVPFIGVGYFGYKLMGKLYESKNKKNR